MNKHKGTIDDFINREYGKLTEGQCSKGCSGKGCYRTGMSGEQSSGCHLTVERRGGALLYHCFGAKCGIGGVVGSSKQSRLETEEASDNVPRVSNKISSLQRIGSYNTPTGFVRWLPEHAADYLLENNIGKEAIVKYDIGFDKDRGRVVFPIHFNGREVGYVSRGLGHGELKWFNKCDSGVIYTSKSLANDIGVLVEAPTSAIVLGGVAPTAALLTSNMCATKERSVIEWARLNKIKHLVIWLDADAVTKARKIRNKLTNHFQSVRLITTEKKPRYYDVDGIKSNIYGWK
tara:strand:+ start:4012 stop:4881 length:870 start_codon:yes stop_codon:yes gene_type:complete